MKISDLDNDIDALSEAPVSGFKQSLRNIGAGALGAIGATNTASHLAGKVDVGDKANQLYTKYNRYAGRQNMSVDNSTAADLRDFLDSVGIEHARYVLGSDEDALNKSELNDVFLRIAKDSYRQTKPSTTAASGTRSGTAAVPAASVLIQIKNDIDRLPDNEKVRLFNYLERTIKQ